MRFLALVEVFSQDDEILTGSKFSTTRNVIQCKQYYFQKSNGNINLFEVSKMVFPQIKEFYIKTFKR